MIATTKTHPRVADRERCALLVVDLQESYRGKLNEEERTVSAAARLLAGAAALGVPVMLTEQVPDRLGATRSEIAEHVPADAARFAKHAFSCLGAEGLREHLAALERDQVVLVGIETHVCVSQTAHDLLHEGYRVHVVRDAVTARYPLEDETGFARMVGSGAVPTSVEAVLFEWLRDSRDPGFKTIHRLVV